METVRFTDSLQVSGNQGESEVEVPMGAILKRAPKGEAMRSRTGGLAHWILYNS